MADAITVRIFGVPVVCSEGVADLWRNVANQAQGQLARRFGERVVVEYYDLMSPEMDRFPEVLAQISSGAQVPLVYVNGELLSQGGKVSVPAIAKHISNLLERAI
ncbi:MAG TPA: hypothetical protein GX500_05605 [Firmicutes bacterium]|nr:hypothetical protein [Candidatus Fermentithermobacillaceae bacterium]